MPRTLPKILQFVPVLLRQRDHARTHRQTDRAKLYHTLIAAAEATPSRQRSCV